MHEPWQNALANSADDPAEPFPSIAELEVAARDGGLVAPLPELGILHVAGADAIEFLHNQLTQSITDIGEDETRLAAWCNPKGRARVLMRIVPSDSGLLLIADAHVLEAITPKLQMFVLRAQVALTSLTPSEGLMGLAGPAAEALLTQTVGSLPSQINGLVRAGDLHVIRLPGDPSPRYLLLAPAAQLSELWQQYRAALTRADAAFWKLLDIRAGLPDVLEQTQETFIPTMLNLEPLQGVVYEKGCYPGQEVIARMHYLGQLKRRMYRARIDIDPPTPGSLIVDTNAAQAGIVVSAAPTAEGGSELLAVLRIDKATDTDLSIDGSPITLLDLPYMPPGLAPASDEH